MAFFEAEIELEKDPVLLGWASRLHSVLVHARRCKPSNLATWAEDFRTLRRQEQDADIDEVLAWFEKHATDKYTPAVFSVKTFSSKFRQIKEAMRRQQESDPYAVQVSSDAWSISRNAGGLIWPGQEKNQELAAIQKLLDEAEQFMRRIGRMGLENEKDRGLAKHIVQAMPGPRELTLARLLDLHRTAWEWPEWQGDLMKFMRLRQGIWFRKMLLGWVREYRGAGNYVELVEALLGDDA